MGHKVIKFPEDLILYQQVLYQKQPDVLVEVGTKFGGSALFFANMFDIIRKGKVISIDVADFPNKPVHPRITYLIGKSLSEEVVKEVKKRVKGKSTMVVLDGSHMMETVNEELRVYGNIVSPGQYMVVEDTHDQRLKVVARFLKRNREFKKTNITNQFLIHLTRDGWLLKRKETYGEQGVHNLQSV